MDKMTGGDSVQLVHIPAEAVTLEGMLVLPRGAPGVVLFAHGSGSSRHSPRNTFVAEVLQRAGLGTLLIDLLSPEEDVSYAARFDIPVLADRLTASTQWLRA
jgi:dienelactone hydrolase